MSGGATRGRRSSRRMRDRDVIYNGSIIDKCVCSDNVRMRE